jgi:hypothetical protein
MDGFNASYLEIEPRELVRYLLRETGQSERSRINPAELLKFLKLDYVSFDFAAELPPDAQQTVGGASPRALISFSDRIVATDESLDDKRTRFSVLHEIGHYVLPNHEHSLYVCDDAGLSFGARLSLEQEANEFAADLLFLGDRFSLDANSRPISAASIKELATAYAASFEATARRLAAKNFRPCMLVSFKKNPNKARVNLEEVPEWTVRYCVTSPAFRTKYFERLTGSVPTDVAAEVTEPRRDIADSCVREIAIRSANQANDVRFRGEFFSNSWNIFGLLTPE